MISHDCKIRVWYKHTDQMGICHHSNYICYYEAARSELLRGSVSAVEQVLAAYDRVTAEDILTLARRVFDFSQVSLAVVGQPDREEVYRALLQ